MDESRPVETTSSYSYCVAASVDTAFHSFVLMSFSQLEGMGAGKFVSSSTFRAGGCGWSIRVYPDGNGLKEEDKAEYVSAFLCLVDGPKGTKITTNYTLKLTFLQDGRLTSHPASLSHTFEAAGSTWGHPKFIEKSKLKPLLRLSNDLVTISCALTVVKKSRYESESEDVAAAAATITEEFSEPNDMQQHFERMLKSGKGKDVTFDVGGQIFNAHRCVLAARSPVFEAQLFGPMKEKAMTTEPIKVADMEPSIFEELLHFIYTGSMSRDSKNGDGDDKTASMQHLLVAADRYGVDRLRIMCEVSLCQGMDARTVATTLALAEQHQFARLKDACLKFIASRDVLAVVMKTEGFKHLVENCPLIAVEILDKIVAEA